MTEPLFRDDPYLQSCSATVLHSEGSCVVLDRSVCYPRGGGQPGDCGRLVAENATAVAISDTTHGPNGAILHHLENDADLQPGQTVMVELDWPRRHAHMRMHTGLHLLGAVIPHGVTGGNISAARSRLDFDMQDSVDKEAITEALNALVSADHPVIGRYISQQELAERPELVRTMSVKPPNNVEQIRLLEIPGVDLQPCGGTHVRSTSEVGALRVAKVEKKGRHNRRVHIVFA